MKKNMNANEMEQVNGGNFIDDMKDILNKIFPDVKDPRKPIIPIIPDPIIPEPIIGRGKC